MKTKLNNLWQNLTASYWFVPSLMSLGAAVAAHAALYLFPQGRTGEGARFGFGWININTGEGARELLATIAGSTITLAGVTFSVTIVALSFASSQYGPRLLRNFMRDRSNQLVLGTFLATYLYCLLVLRTVGGEDSADQLVPHAAVAGALLFSIASLGMLIYFIHHVAKSIQVSSMVAGVGGDLDDAIAALERRPLASRLQQPEAHGRAQTVRARRPGYVQALAEEALLACAQHHDAAIRLEVAPGDYVGFGQPLATLTARQPKATLEEACEKELHDCVILGPDRSNEQDIEFPIDQLAEMAVRALSRSKNDIFTVVLCINRLGSGLTQIATIAERDSFLRDPDGTPRVELRLSTMDRMLRRAFAQTLAHADGKLLVHRQIMKALAIAASQALPVHRRSLVDFADQVRHAAESEPAENKVFEEIMRFYRELHP